MLPHPMMMTRPAKSTWLKWPPRESSLPGLNRRDFPDRVGQVIGDDQCTARIHRHANRATARLSIAPESRYEIHRVAGGLAVAERHEDHFEADRRIAIPATVFSDECAVGKRRAHGDVRKRKTKHRDV